MIETVPESGQVCPDCSGFIEGCEGLVTFIYGYNKWRFALSGEEGWCNNPTKTVPVGAIVKCTENWSAFAITKCASESGLCAYACSTGPTWACVACLVLAGADCALDGVCAFVEKCEPSQNPDDTTPIEKQVVDYAGNFYGTCSG